MSTFKITNISKMVGKRDPNYDSTLTISYVHNMKNNKYFLKPDDVVYLTIDKLPISVHKLRVKKLVSVVEVSESELKKSMIKTPSKTENVTAVKPTPKKTTPKTEKEEKDDKPTKSSQKKTTTKDSGYYDNLKK